MKRKKKQRDSSAERLFPRGGVHSSVDLRNWGRRVCAVGAFEAQGPDIWTRTLCRADRNANSERADAGVFVWNINSCLIPRFYGRFQQNCCQLCNSYLSHGIIMQARFRIWVSRMWATSQPNLSHRWSYSDFMFIHRGQRRKAYFVQSLWLRF